MIVPASPSIGSIQSAFDCAPATNSDVELMSINNPPVGACRLYDSAETPSASGGDACEPSHMPSPSVSVHPHATTFSGAAQTSPQLIQTD